MLTAPPPLLDDVCVVLVSPKRPISVGTVARSLACFECEDLRIVEPRCDHLARSSRNGSKGAQFLLWRAEQHGTLQDALADADFSVACTRWVAGKLCSDSRCWRWRRRLCSTFCASQADPLCHLPLAGRPNAFRSVSELLAAPQIAALLQSSSRIAEPVLSSEQQQQQQQSARQGRRKKKLALVFGREVSGLTAAEVGACDGTLSIPIGRLQGECVRRNGQAGTWCPMQRWPECRYRLPTLPHTHPCRVHVVEPRRERRAVAAV